MYKEIALDEVKLLPHIFYTNAKFRSFFLQHFLCKWYMCQFWNSVDQGFTHIFDMQILQYVAILI